MNCSGSTKKCDGVTLALGGSRYCRPFESTQFQRWFAGSKVARENGSPVVVYHGTQKGGFSAFNTKQGFSDDWFTSGHPTAKLGTWFSEDCEVANEFSVPRTGIRVPSEARPMTYPVYLAIKNPKIYSDFSEMKSDLDRYGALPLRMKLQRDGFDGILIEKSTTDFHQARHDWVAFFPEQIKSIFNKGTWDSENESISA